MGVGVFYPGRGKLAIVKANGISPLVGLVQHGSPGGQQAAAKALWNLSLVDAHRRLIGQAGAVRPLMNLLLNGEPPAREAAAGNEERGSIGSCRRLKS